ncbi:coiled-coil domain-containing protein 187 [Eudromia elegans]
MEEAAKDVALAWRSLQEAKAVLQRIENKLDHQTWSCAKCQAARRTLWYEESSDEKNGDETAWDEKSSMKFSGASAWRQGQMLAKKLLGPSPKIAALRSTAEEHILSNTLEPGGRFAAVPARERNPRERGSKCVRKSPVLKSCMVPTSEHDEKGRNSLDEAEKQLLSNLHLQSEHAEHRNTKLPEDIVKGKAEDLQHHLGIDFASSGVESMTHSLFGGEKTRSSLRRAEPEHSNCNRGKNSSQGWKDSRSLAQKGSEKENLNHPSKRRANLRNPHPYSPEIIREYMYRKNIERKRKRLEEKKSLVQAREMRNKRLQEVYRKQKEAFGKKTCSGQMQNFIKEGDSAEGGPQSELEHKQLSSGTLERSFMAWGHKTSRTLSKEPRSRDRLIETTQPPTKGEALASPAAQESKCWFLRALKCEDLQDGSCPAPCTPPLSISLARQDAGPGSKHLLFGISPCRSKQDRVKAIHRLSLELAEKVELATGRMNAASRVQDSANKIPTQTTLDLFKESSCLEHETSKDEQDKTMTLQMLLEAPDPDKLHVSSDREFHELGKTSLTCSPEGATVQDRHKTIHASSSGDSAARKELPQVTSSVRRRHLDTGEDLSSTSKGFLVTKGSEVDTSLVHGKPIGSPASPSCSLLGGRNKPCVLWAYSVISGNLNSDKLGGGDLRCPKLEEKPGSHLGRWRRVSLQLAQQTRARHLLQKQQLAMLSEKAKLEVQESQRSLKELLQHDLEDEHSAPTPTETALNEQQFAEIKYLQNICKAARQERKLLLKQQRELLMMRHSAARLQEELNNLAGKQELLKSAAIKQQAARPISSPALQPTSAESTAQSERADLSEHRVCCLQLKEKQAKEYEGFSTKNKEPLVQHQEEAEEAPGLEQSLSAQTPDVSEAVDKNLCDTVGQNTGSLSMAKDHKNTEFNAQDDVFLHLEHAHSARIDEAISTPIPGGGRKYAYPESVLEEKAFISSPKLDLKNNEDINPCDRKFTVKGLGMLSTLCNLCLVRAEDTLQETGVSTSPVEEGLEEDSLTVEKVHRMRISHGTPEKQDSSSSFQAGGSEEHNFSPTGGSAKSDSSLAGFQKVSAIWIDISESSTSDSELEVKNGEDTDISIPEEFTYDNGEVFPDITTQTLIATNAGKEVLRDDKHDEQVPKADCSPEMSSHCQSSQKKYGNVSDHECTDHLLYFIPTDKGNGSKTKSPCSLQSDNPTREMDEPHLEASEDDGRNVPSSPEISEQDKDAEKDIATDKLVACPSSRDLPLSEGEDNTQLFHEKLASSKLNEIVSLPTCMPGICEEVHAKTEISSHESLQRVATENQNNSPAERQAVKEMGRALFSFDSSKQQLFQAENCSSKAEDDTIFISDEGLLAADADTLSELLSPVDEVLSYGSADLPSASRRDLSFPREDLPPPPLGVDAMKNDDSSFSTDDFPSPPEQMIFSETRQCMDEDISLKMDALLPLPDNTVPEEFPAFDPASSDAFSTQDGNLSEQSLVEEYISSPKKDFLEQEQGGCKMSLQCSEFLHVPNPVSSDDASKNTELVKELHKTRSTLPKAEEDGDDPLSSFEIGDRVLVKKTQSGTLMFKGQTCFDSGYWAGVALDKAEGDHAGTYQGVKYFECAQNCGIFVRPDQISHLLEVNESGPGYTEDEDSFSGDESFPGGCKYTEDEKQGAGFTEQKAEDTNSEGGAEVKDKQSRLHLTLLSGKGQKIPSYGQCKRNEFVCQNNSTCLRSDKEKAELEQIKQGIRLDVLLMENKTNGGDEGNTSKNICCSVDQKRNKLADDIASEPSKKLLFEALIVFSEIAQHKPKSALEKEVMNYSKGPQQDNQKQSLFKENPTDNLSEPSAKVSEVLLWDFDMLSSHGCHAVAERIVTKFVDDAVKEYKKMKRKHGEKADRIFHSSSDTSATPLPFLVKLLDAGVFGSSEDFDQPNCDQRALERQTPRQYLYKSDQWHSAPWKKTVEIPLVVPHHSSHVKKWSAWAVEELWTPENMHSNCRKINVPRHSECDDFSGNKFETESKRMYNQIIFDLTHELLCAEYHAAVNPNTFPWLKDDLGSHCSRRLGGRTDVNEVKTFVQGEIIKIMNLEKNDIEMKRKFLNMTKYGNCKRDRVDLILIEELREEEPQWTYYDDDELTVKMRITEDIFDSLILDTIGVLNKIYRRRRCD